jgi:hypothetical protein
MLPRMAFVQRNRTQRSANREAAGSVARAGILDRLGWRARGPFAARLVPGISMPPDNIAAGRRRGGM